MKKLTPNGNRLVVKSRGVKEEMECGLYVSAKFLDDSSVCVSECGRIVIIRYMAGVPLDGGRLLIDEGDVLADVVGGDVVPAEGWLLIRKCIDEPDESGLVGMDVRGNRMGEVLAGGTRHGVKDCDGWLAYVADHVDPQKVEDTQDDWLVYEDGIAFFYKEEDE